MSLYRKASLGLALTISMAVLASGAKADNLLTFSSAATSPQATFSADGSGGGTLTFVSLPQGIDASSFSSAFGQPIVGSYSNLIYLTELTSGGPFTMSSVALSGGVWSGAVSGTYGVTIMSNIGTILDGTASNLVFSAVGGPTFVSWFLTGDIAYNSAQAITDYNSGGLISNMLGSVSFTGTNFGAGSGLTTTNGGTRLGGFDTNLSGTFSTSAVPEPGEWAAMGILATGLGGLLVRARRKSA